MLVLMKKFSSMFLLYQGLYYLLLFPMMNYDRLTGPDPLDLSFVFYISSFMYLLIIGSVWGQEQLEHKSRGYAFLRTLPLKWKKIVSAKFLVIIIAVVIYIAVHALWFASSFDNPDYVSAALENLLIIGSTCLAIAGLVMVGFMKWGYHTFGKFAIMIWVVLMISPLPLLILLKEKFGIRSGDIAKAVTALNPILIALLGMAVFIASMLVCIRLAQNNATQERLS